MLCVILSLHVLMYCRNQKRSKESWMDATSQMKEGAFFKDAVQNIIDKQHGETVYYLHPTAKMTKKEGDHSVYAASSIYNLCRYFKQS